MNLARHLPYPLVNLIRAITPGFGRYGRRSYAQEGEDALLRRIIGFTGCGFYVDVGAHHPMRLSNTHMLYRRGWQGINIDAAPGSMLPFKVWRRRDINLELAISESSKGVDFHVFSEPARNTADPAIATQRQTCGGEKNRPVRVIHVPSMPLRQVLEQYLPHGVKVDLLNVDVEGYDLQVLQSNDWNHFRPTFVLAETLSQTLDSVSSTDVYKFMVQVGYTGMSKLLHTVLFVENSRVQHVLSGSLAEPKKGGHE